MKTEGSKIEKKHLRKLEIILIWPLILVKSPVLRSNLMWASFDFELKNLHDMLNSSF